MAINTVRLTAGVLMLTSVAMALSGCAPPQQTPRAGERTAVAPDPTPGTTPDGRPVIVRLVGRGRVVTVAHAADGPRYSIRMSGGRDVLVDATAAELAAADPALYEQLQSALAPHGQDDDAHRETSPRPSGTRVGPTAWAGQ